MKMLGAVAVFLLALTTVAGGDVEKQTKALQGKWQGRVGDKDDVEFVIDGKKWSATVKGKADFSMKGTFTIDPKVLPHTIDLKVEEGKGEGGEGFAGKTSLGIYELKDGTLRLTAAEPGKETRPNEFVNREGQVYLELRQVK